MARRLGKVEYYGPFFEHDPAKTLRQNMREASRQMADAGVQMVRAEYGPGKGSALADTISSRGVGQEQLWHVLESRMSKENPERSWVTWMEVAQRRRPGGGDLIRGKRFKGNRVWSRVRSTLRRQAKLTVEQLTRGVS